MQRGAGAHCWVMESAGLGMKTLPKHSQPPGPPPSITLDPAPNIHHPQEPSMHPSDALQTHSKSPSSPAIPQPALLSLRSDRNPIFHVKTPFPYKHSQLPGNLGCYRAAASSGHQRLHVCRMCQHTEMNPKTFLGTNGSPFLGVIRNRDKVWGGPKP